MTGEYLTRKTSVHPFRLSRASIDARLNGDLYTRCGWNVERLVCGMAKRNEQLWNWCHHYRITVTLKKWKFRTTRKRKDENRENSKKKKNKTKRNNIKWNEKMLMQPHTYPIWMVWHVSVTVSFHFVHICIHIQISNPEISSLQWRRNGRLNVVTRINMMKCKDERSNTCFSRLKKIFCSFLIPPVAMPSIKYISRFKSFECNLRIGLLSGSLDRCHEAVLH